MQKRNYRGVRCEKRSFEKCEGVCKTFNAIQSKYAEALQDNPDVQSFRTNVPLNGLEDGDFTSDFVAVKTDGELMVRECVWRKNITRPRTLKLLDASRFYWMKRGVEDWGIVVDKKTEEGQQ